MLEAVRTSRSYHYCETFPAATLPGRFNIKQVWCRAIATALPGLYRLLRLSTVHVTCTISGLSQPVVLPPLQGGGERSEEA